MANTKGEKELLTDWPIVSGLDANSKHHGRKLNLVATKGSFVSKRFKKGF